MDEEKVTLQDQLIELLTKNNDKLVKYIFEQIEMRYDLTPNYLSPQDINDAIDEDKNWTEEE